MVGRVKPRRQQIVVAAVIVNKSKEVLIVRRPLAEAVLPGYFELPGGKKEIGENTSEALRREVKEEVGLDIDNAKPFSVFDYEVGKPDYVRETTQINFLVRFDDDGPKITLTEHDDYRWIGEEELGLVKISGQTRETITAAFRLL